jgi:hypothetical protein
LAVRWRSRLLYRETETPTLFGPGEWHGTQEPLEGQPAGLPTFGDGFHDVGRKESKSQDPPHVSFAQIAFARNLGRVGVFTPADRRRPGSASRHRKDERTVETRGRCTGIARNNNFFAISVTPFQWHAEDLLTDRPEGWRSDVTRLKNDLGLRCMNHDPFDMTADQIARALIIRAAGIAGWNLLF